MARKKNMVLGAGEAPNEQISTNSPVVLGVPESFPVTFGKGEFTSEFLGTIKDKTDSKIRLVYDFKDENDVNTKSGAVYVGNKLVSSKVLDVTKTETESGTKLTVTFINADEDKVDTIEFDIVDSEALGELDEKVEALETYAKDTNIENGGAITVDVSGGEDDFKQYTLSVNTDQENIDIVDDKLTVSEYKIVKVPSDDADFDDENYAAQYKLMVKKPGADDFEKAGETINIFKDFVLKGAHVCTFDKDENGDPFIVPTDPEIKAFDVYAKVYDKNCADITIHDDTTGEDIYLEKAPQNKGLFVGHTYLHLIVNINGDDHEIVDTESLNDTATDVYLDFTEILGAGEFKELVDKVSEIDSRLETIEGGYIQGLTIPEQEDEYGFKTITVKTVNDGVETESSFDIPGQSYFEAINNNFITLEANDEVFKQILTWSGLD